ncbi:DUF1580 domain-containing protein [Aeoliella mucimassa]|uniref:DUF1580 domain-containing protein n=1 Tax=Aeoliella mucimassa TaxID=2527972 RepID=UPI0036F49994
MLSVGQAQLVFATLPSKPTLWRWLLKGTRGVAIESVFIGGRRFTSREACSRFINATSAPKPSQKRPASEQREAVRVAQSILDQFGI